MRDRDDDLPEVFRDMAPWQRLWLLGFPRIAPYILGIMFLLVVVASIIKLVKYSLGY